MPFTKGDPRINRNGRPKKEKTLTGLIIKELEKQDVTTSTGDKITRKEAMARVMTNQAVAGDFQFMKLVLEYVDGKPDVFQQIDLDGDLRIPNLIVKSFQTQDEDASDT